MRLAVVLFNLGGPDRPEAIEPFLINLFSDPAIIALPEFLRRPLAHLIAARRVPVARDIYAKIGGSSPIREQTEAQARALEGALHGEGRVVRVFIAMRCWMPFGSGTVESVLAWKPDRIVLLPLYPQFSTTTTASSFEDWEKAAKHVGLSATETRICCYPDEPGFILASATLIGQAMTKRRSDVRYRLLLSAHGLPERVVARGDPYRRQIERSAEAIAATLGMEGLDWNVCYQSRVGPLKWIGPATDGEIRRAGAEGVGLIVAPIAFVSEHSETLVELDIEYAKLAARSGVKDYIRVPAVGTQKEFINGLARLVLEAVEDGRPSGARKRICPGEFPCCGFPMEEG